MPGRNKSFPLVREAVASFANRTQLDDAINRLMAAGFARDDISVLGSHASLEAPSGNADAMAGLVEEVKYIAPLTVAGIVLLSGGPIAASIAGVIGAGLGGAALKELLDRYAAGGRAEEFAAALQAGAVLLWVRVPDPELEATAVRVLEDAGGRNAHLHARTASEAASGAAEH
jgi:hypothetical protein